MESLVIAIHVLAAIGITGLVLMQHGKGADMGASFGSGASQTIFGSVGSGNVLTKSTTWLAVVFFVTSLTLALFARQQAGQGIETESLIENVDQLEALSGGTAQQDIPAVPASDSDIPQADVPQAVIDQAVEAVQQTLDEQQTEQASPATEAAPNEVEQAPAESADAPPPAAEN